MRNSAPRTLLPLVNSFPIHCIRYEGIRTVSLGLPSPPPPGLGWRTCFFIRHAGPKVSISCAFCPNCEGQQDTDSVLPVLLKVTSSSRSPGYLCGYPTLPTPFRKDKRWLTPKTHVCTINKTKRKARPRKEGESLLIPWCVSVKMCLGDSRLLECGLG